MAFWGVVLASFNREPEEVAAIGLVLKLDLFGNLRRGASVGTTLNLGGTLGIVNMPGEIFPLHSHAGYNDFANSEFFRPAENEM